MGSHDDMATIPYLGTDSFTPALAEEGRPVLVDFTAGWCPPCRAIAPALEEIAAEQSDRLAIAKVDVDAEPEIAARFGVQSLPTLVVFVDGEERHRFVGARPKSGILNEVAPFLGSDQ